MDELEGDEWVEQARWIKYEEDRQAGAERWGKAHISSLSFHALINLRLSLENGTGPLIHTIMNGCYQLALYLGVFILDLEAANLTEVVHRIVEDLCVDGAIEDHQKAEIMRILLYKHKYVSEGGHFLHHQSSHKISGLKKSFSGKSLSVRDRDISND